MFSLEIPTPALRKLFFDWVLTQSIHPSGNALNSSHLVHRLFGFPILGKRHKNKQTIKLAGTYVNIPAPLLEKSGSKFFNITRKDPLPTITLENAFLTREGLLFQGMRISPYSSFYGMVTLKKLFSGWRQVLMARGTAQRVDSACFVSQQTVYKGSFGDYCIEYLSTLCSDLPPRGSRIVMAENFVGKFSAEDFSELGLKAMPIPSLGVGVDRLRVIPPCQFFDNFTMENVQSIRRSFPERCNTSNQNRVEKIYLSRHGFFRNSDIRSSTTGREILNEEEVETFLAARDFSIIRPHEMSNTAVRSALSHAGIVVAAHGAAMFHLIWNPPTKIIELAHLDWHLPSFLKLAQAAGVPEYRMICTSEGRISIKELSDHLIG